MIKFNLKALIRLVSWRTVQNPTLNVKIRTKTIKSTLSLHKNKSNHHKPGFVYIFEDPNTRLCWGVSLCKIGLSRSPKSRRYFLSREYETDLQVRAIVPTLDMKLTEDFMHTIFNSCRARRTPGLDGYTEWFRVNFVQLKLMQLTLIGTALLVSTVYLIVIIFVLSLIFLLYWILIF
jgi:hypothetical protein